MLLQKAPGVSTPEELLHQLTQLQREAASATSALGNRNTEIRELQGTCVHHSSVLRAMHEKQLRNHHAEPAPVQVTDL